MISEHEDGLGMSLYIAVEVIKQLENIHPEDLLGQGKYSEFCLMLEGVSHFLYVIWNAHHDKKVTQLEMELQAEIDKFILLHSLLIKDGNRHDIDTLQNWLFEDNKFNEMLSDVQLERYKQANYYAAKFCRGLQQQYRLCDLNKDLLNELRRFYRLGQENKIRYINQLH